MNLSGSKSLLGITTRPIHHIKSKSCPLSHRIMGNIFSGQTVWSYNGEMTFSISRGENADVQLSLRLPASHSSACQLVRIIRYCAAALLTNYSIKISEQLGWERPCITAATDLMEPLELGGTPSVVCRVVHHCHRPSHGDVCVMQQIKPSNPLL